MAPRRTRNTFASGSLTIMADRQTDADQSTTVRSKAKERKTAGSATSNKTTRAPLQPVVANTRDADAEIAELKVQLAEAQRLRKEAQGKSTLERVVPHVAKENDRQDIVTIQKPKGEAGNKKSGFNLREAMGLDDIAKKDMYDAIQRSIRTNAIRAGLDFAADYRRQDPEKLANVFKMTRKDHPYMTKKRFPADWSAAEILKQYMKNHRRHAVRKGRMENRAERKRKEQDDADSEEGSGLHNVDHNYSDPQNNEDSD